MTKIKNMLNLKKLVEYGLYLLVFLLPIQTRWIINPGASEYETYSVYGTDILLLVLLGLFAVYNVTPSNPAGRRNTQHVTKKNKENEKKKSVMCYVMSDTCIWWYIAGLELIILISIFIADNKLLALYKYAWFLLGVGFTLN